MLRRSLGIGSGKKAHKDNVGIRIGAPRRDDAVERSGDARPVERRIRRSPAALPEDGVAVLEELRLLRILQRDEGHRIASRGEHAPGESGDGVAVPADADRISEPEPRCFVDHGLLVATGGILPRRQKPGLPRCNGFGFNLRDRHGNGNRRPGVHQRKDKQPVGNINNAALSRLRPFIDPLLTHKRPGSSIPLLKMENDSGACRSIVCASPARSDWIASP